MNSLSLQFKNLQVPDIWEVKDAINKVKNAVLKYTEMEAKVHEATNNEPWGPSSTLMQQIAQATHNYAHFNEIMPTIYKRFTDKEAKQWRQIYKSLVLLEYLVKNGSERVIDDTRSHMSMIKMMRTFHYIDEKGKDQGINVRNRAKELAGLLEDTEKIRVERKKARLNRNKYQGVGSTPSAYGGMGSIEGNGGFGRISGFGSDSISSSNLGISSIKSTTNYNGTRFSDEYERPNRFQGSKYDDFSDEDNDSTIDCGLPKVQQTQATSASEDKKEVNLFDFENDTTQSIAAKGKEKYDDDEWGDFATGTTHDALDDFDDFQSAPALPSKIAAGAPSSSASGDLLDLLSDDTFVAPLPVSATVASSTPMTTASAVTANSPGSYQSLAPNTPSTSATQPPSPSPFHHNNIGSKVSAGNIWSQSSFASLDLLMKQPNHGGNNNNSNSNPALTSMNALKASSTSTWNSSNTANRNNIPENNSLTPMKNTIASSAFDDLLSF
ncbi:hypothetical protein BX666DRAFT_1873647 [Dichotomocladium elegans]|nr:hypothetical protein BX666DRAFT_1873647 [Dichotomocladium elegans]